MSRALSQGASFPLAELSPEDRNADIQFMLQYGNHKSAKTNSEIVTDLLKEDIERGFALPLPLQAIHSLTHKEISISPLGCQEQDTINELGEIIKKNRLTHDHSFPGPSGNSPNIRTQSELLPPCKYGHCIKRIINYIISLRLRHPSTPIFISKFDFDAAFRRCHMSLESALESCCVLNNLLIIPLRLTFGGSSCPNLWGTFSETICDLANEIIQNEAWDHKVLFDALSHQIIVPKRIPPDIPFSAALPLAIDVPFNDKGKGDVFIDDNIFITPDINDNIERVAKAVPLAINTVSRQSHQNEPLPRKPILSMKKFIAEATMEESKTILGWLINTRQLSIHLPDNKFIAWSEAIQKLINNNVASSKELHTIEGRLNHAAFIIPTARHFLSRLRHLRIFSEKSRTQQTTISIEVKRDLNLFQKFLRWANNGISLNLISYRSPTIFLRSDASSTGLGGYNIYSGHAWRFSLPTHLLERAHINTLEFLAALITIWVNLSRGNIKSEDCILCQTDSTTAAAWLNKTNFSDKTSPSENSIRLIIARKLASLILESHTCLYSQWFQGDKNIIADALSREHEISNEHLVLSLTSSYPTQTPAGLKICHLPREVSSWICLMLLQLPKQTPARQPPHRSTPDPGTAGSVSSRPSESTHQTPSWTDSTQEPNISSSAHSWQPSDQTPSQIAKSVDL
jgi:hypothetical protein